MGVRCDDFESGLDSFGSGATTNVQEVGRATAVELDNVHGSHGKTSTVDKTTNGTVETNVVEVVLGSLDFTRVLLSGVTEGKGVLLSELGIVIKVELSVHAEDYQRL